MDLFRNVTGHWYKTVPHYVLRNVTGHTVGQGSTFELYIYYCGVMLLTADNILCLVRVIYPSLETPRNV